MEAPVQSTRERSERVDRLFLYACRLVGGSGRIERMSPDRLREQPLARPQVSRDGVDARNRQGGEHCLVRSLRAPAAVHVLQRVDQIQRAAGRSHETTAPHER